MANVAYLRVSTEKQKTDRQFNDNLDQFDKVFEEQASGKDLDRVAFQECMKYISRGDTLHVWEISRLSRSVVDLHTTVKSLIDKGIGIKFHKEGLEFCANMSEPMKAAVSKMLMTLLGAVAEFEREMISIRTKEGMAAKAKRGVKFGAAAEAYDKTNSVSKRNRKEATDRAQPYREFITVMLVTLTDPTLRSMADYLTKADKPLPSGDVGKWKPAQVKRVMQRLGLYEEFINKKQQKDVA